LITKNGEESGMSLTKGFFFDLDGTLVDTHEANFRSYYDAIQHVTALNMDERLKTHIMAGESSDIFLKKLIPELNSDDIAKINRYKKEVYPNHLHISELNEYLSVFLQQMSVHYTTALVTTAKRKNALAVLNAHNLEKYFSFMIFGDDVTAMKPNPEAYLLALKKSGLQAHEVIAFEDSQKGIDAAVAANISYIHIRNFS
jgi:HAD superfamily hydrolase (TIGR01509 family)